MGKTDDEKTEEPVTTDAPAPETAEDDGDGLAPGQTTADNYGDVLGV